MLFFSCSSHFIHFIPATSIFAKVVAAFLVEGHSHLKRYSNVSKLLSQHGIFGCAAHSHASVHTQVQSSRGQMNAFTISLDWVPFSSSRIYEFFMYIILDTNYVFPLLQEISSSTLQEHWFPGKVYESNLNTKYYVIVCNTTTKRMIFSMFYSTT